MNEIDDEDAEPFDINIGPPKEEENKQEEKKRRPTWIQTLPPDERKKILEKAIERSREVREKRKRIIELDDIIDVDSLDLNKEEDVDKLIRAIIKYLSQTSRVSIYSRPTIRLLLEAVDIYNTRETMKKVKQIEQENQKLKEELEKLKKKAVDVQIISSETKTTQ